MSILFTIILAVQLLAAITMIGLILIQHGKGADMGAAFGSGGSGSLFGASGSANFLSRTTAVLAAVFFVCTLALAYAGNLRPTGSGSVLEGTIAPPEAGVTPPVRPASGAAQIPGGAPAAAPAGTPATGAAAVPAAPASGAGQIPTR
jgi:preprotein translocase subunit SecG